MDCVPFTLPDAVHDCFHHEMLCNTGAVHNRQVVPSANLMVDYQAHTVH